MTIEDETHVPSEDETSGESEGDPVIEDALSPQVSEDEVVPEDDPDLLDPSARSLDIDDQDDGQGEEAAGSAVVATAEQAVESDDEGDADKISDEPEPAGDGTQPAPAPPVSDCERERSAHRIAVELKHAESEVRQLLEGRDSKRKRKLSGSRRWRELEEDVIQWRYSSRCDEDSLARLRELVARRNYLFQRLNFIAGTRSGGNS